MMEPHIYFDTSAWLKLYIDEEGSMQARSLASRRIVSSAILHAESLSALKRRHANRELPKLVFKRLVKQISVDVTCIDTMPVSGLNLRRAESIVIATPAGALDAMHIAAALLFQELTGLKIPFITADKRQALSAEQVGLEVVLC